MIKDFDQLKVRAKNLPEKKRLAVACAQDQHTLEAVIEAKDEGIVDPILIGQEEKIREILKEIGEDCSSFQIINIEDKMESVQKAADMINQGQADFIMKGKIETGSLMKVLVNKDKGIRKNDTMSILAFMDSPNYHKVFGITDVGLCTYPDKDMKKAILKNAVDAFFALGIEEPKVGIIAAVEKRNEKMPETVDADEIKKEGMKGAIIEGPISFDLAMDRESADIKGYESPVAGDCDILLVPDIVSGNIAAKSLTVLGGARTGGVVLGAKAPVLIVSRSATEDDKYMSIVMAALLAEGMEK